MKLQVYGGTKLITLHCRYIQLVNLTLGEDTLSIPTPPHPTHVLRHFYGKDSKEDYEVQVGDYWAGGGQVMR